MAAVPELDEVELLVVAPLLAATPDDEATPEPELVLEPDVAPDVDAAPEVELWLPEPPLDVDCPLAPLAAPGAKHRPRPASPNTQTQLLGQGLSVVQAIVPGAIAWLQSVKIAREIKADQRSMLRIAQPLD